MVNTIDIKGKTIYFKLLFSYFIKMIVDLMNNMTHIINASANNGPNPPILTSGNISCSISSGYTLKGNLSLGSPE